MIYKSTLQFLEQLKLNNSKEWLDENKKLYEDAKNNILKVTDNLITYLSSIDSSVSNALLDSKKCITRLNRDLRFAKDKTPYKTDYYCVVNKNGKNSGSAFYYLRIEPGNCFVGGGVYNPQALELKKIRKEINYFFNEWKSITDVDAFKISFPTGIHNSGILQKIPKDFTEINSKASEFLKMKGFYTMKKISDDEITSEATFEKIKSCLNATKPLVDFLNRAIDTD